MANVKHEKSKYRREHVFNAAVILWDDRYEECRLHDLSASGAHLRLRERPDVGSKITVFIDDFGRYEGKVRRHSPQGIGVSFVTTSRVLDRTLRRLQERSSESMAKNAASLSGEQRTLLESLLIAGELASSRKSITRHFWQLIDSCRAAGWVKADLVAQDFYRIEITPAGQRMLSGKIDRD